MRRSSPPRPWRRLPWPCTPLVARRCGWSRKARREATLRSATSQMSPPLPPSPPSGPPLGTWASRRNATLPAPPSPALTCRPHSSTNPDTQARLGVEVRQSAGSTSTYFRPRRCANFTEPGAFANNVSSPPRPTFSPGWNLVPRWRTMMAPAVTIVPSYTFTPRRWAWESRPLRVEPPPLVLDIDAHDLHDVVLLAVAPADPGPALVLVLEAGDLRTLGLADHSGRDLGALQLVRGGEDRLAIDHEHGGQCHLVPHGCAQALDLDPLTLGDPRLLSTRLHDRIHKATILPAPGHPLHLAVPAGQKRPAGTAKSQCHTPFLRLCSHETGCGDRRDHRWTAGLYRSPTAARDRRRLEGDHSPAAIQALARTVTSSLGALRNPGLCGVASVCRRAGSGRRRTPCGRVRRVVVGSRTFISLATCRCHGRSLHRGVHRRHRTHLSAAQHSRPMAHHLQKHPNRSSGVVHLSNVRPRE